MHTGFDVSEGPSRLVRVRDGTHDPRDGSHDAPQAALRRHRSTSSEELQSVTRRALSIAQALFTARSPSQARAICRNRTNVRTHDSTLPAHRADTLPELPALSSHRSAYGQTSRVTGSSIEASGLDRVAGTLRVS